LHQLLLLLSRLIQLHLLVRVVCCICFGRLLLLSHPPLLLLLRWLPLHLLL
jgi:hypothetical protein